MSFTNLFPPIEESVRLVVDLETPLIVNFSDFHLKKTTENPLDSCGLVNGKRIKKNWATQPNNKRTPEKLTGDPHLTILFHQLKLLVMKISSRFAGSKTNIGSEPFPVGGSNLKMFLLGCAKEMLASLWSQTTGNSVATQQPTHQAPKIVPSSIPTLSPFKILSVNNELKAEATADPGSQMHPFNRHGNQGWFQSKLSSWPFFPLDVKTQDFDFWPFSPLKSSAACFFHLLGPWKKHVKRV